MRVIEWENVRVGGGTEVEGQADSVLRGSGCLIPGL